MKKVFYYFLLFLFSFVTFSCDDNDEGGVKNSDEITITTKSYETYLHFEFINAKTGEYLTQEKVTITVLGKDANSVYDNIGVNEDEYTTEVGMFDLVVDPAKTTSDFIVKASANGYSDYYYRARINETKFTPIRIPMVSLSNLPEGVSKAEEKITIPSDGKIKETISISLNSANTVKIPEGTTFKDASGNVISGNVESKILFYDPSKEAASYAFPGGLNVEAVTPEGQTADITFFSAGVFDIEINSGNKMVKSIEGEGIQLTTKLNSSLINPNTGNPIKENDEIEMWSTNPETGLWVYEKTAKIKRNANGELYLQENIDHLSYWNWDWYGNTCSLGSKIKWEGNASGVSVLIKNQHPLNSYVSKKNVLVDVNDSYNNYVQFQNVPRNMPTTFTFEGTGVYKENLTFEPSILSILNLCDGKTYTVKVTDNGDYNYYHIDLDLKVVSKSNPNISLYIYNWGYIRPYSSTYYSYCYINNGKLKTKILAEEDYQLCIYLGNYYGYGKVKVEEIGNNKLKVKITPNFVYNYTNGAIVDAPIEEMIVDKPADNIIKVSATFALSDEEINKLR